MGSNFTLELADEAATLAFGAALSKALVPSLTIYLHGDLGAGKTTLVRGLLHALGHAGKVKSPTYTLVETYMLSHYNLHHFDLYRFNDDEEWEAAGFRDYFNEQSVCMIEWPEKAAHVLPVADINVSLSIQGAGRHATFEASTELGQQSLERMKSI